MTHLEPNQRPFLSIVMFVKLCTLMPLAELAFEVDAAGLDKIY